MGTQTSLVLTIFNYMKTKQICRKSCQKLNYAKIRAYRNRGLIVSGQIERQVWGGSVWCSCGLDGIIREMKAMVCDVGVEMCTSGGKWVLNAVLFVMAYRGCSSYKDDVYHKVLTSCFAHNFIITFQYKESNFLAQKESIIRACSISHCLSPGKWGHHNTTRKFKCMQCCITQYGDKNAFWVVIWLLAQPNQLNGHSNCLLPAQPEPPIPCPSDTAKALNVFFFLWSFGSVDWAISVCFCMIIPWK